MKALTIALLALTASAATAQQGPQVDVNVQGDNIVVDVTVRYAEPPAPVAAPVAVPFVIGCIEPVFGTWSHVTFANWVPQGTPCHFAAPQYDAWGRYMGTVTLWGNTFAPPW